MLHTQSALAGEDTHTKNTLYAQLYNKFKVQSSQRCVGIWPLLYSRQHLVYQSL